MTYSYRIVFFFARNPFLCISQNIHAMIGSVKAVTIDHYFCALQTPRRRHHLIHQEMMPYSLTYTHQDSTTSITLTVENSLSFLHSVSSSKECRDIAAATFFLASSFSSLQRAAPNLVNPMKVFIFVSCAAAGDVCPMRCIQLTYFIASLLFFTHRKL